MTLGQEGHRIKAREQEGIGGALAGVEAQVGMGMSVVAGREGACTEPAAAGSTAARAAAAAAVAAVAAGQRPAAAGR